MAPSRRASATSDDARPEERTSPGRSARPHADADARGGERAERRDLRGRPRGEDHGVGRAGFTVEGSVLRSHISASGISNPANVSERKAAVSGRDAIQLRRSSSSRSRTWSTQVSGSSVSMLPIFPIAQAVFMPGFDCTCGASHSHDEITVDSPCAGCPGQFRGCPGTPGMPAVARLFR